MWQRFLFMQEEEMLDVDIILIFLMRMDVIINALSPLHLSLNPCGHETAFNSLSRYFQFARDLLQPNIRFVLRHCPQIYQSWRKYIPTVKSLQKYGGFSQLTGGFY